MSQHFARIENSPRLQRILEVLKDGEWHSTRAIQLKADVCAVGAAMSEIDKNGIGYETRYIDGHYEYRLLPKPVAIGPQEDMFRAGFDGRAVSK